MRTPYIAVNFNGRNLIPQWGPALISVTVTDEKGLESDKVTIELQADKPAWMKAGAQVKIKNVGPGKVAEISGKTVTITSKKASSLKAGDDVSIDKGGMSGC